MYYAPIPLTINNPNDLGKAPNSLPDSLPNLLIERSLTNHNNPKRKAYA